MKIRVLLISLFCSLFAVCSVRAADHPMKHDDDETELGDHMEKMSSAYKKLNREIADPSKNEDSLKFLAVIHAQAEAALKLEPAKAADIPADQRPKFVENYQKKMQAFIGDIEKVQAALKAGNNEQAKQLLATLKQDQREGHKEFQKEKHKM